MHIFKTQIKLMDDIEAAQNKMHDAYLLTRQEVEQWIK